MSLTIPRPRGENREDPRVVTVASRDNRRVLVRDPSLRETLRRADQLAVKLAAQTRIAERPAR